MTDSKMLMMNSDWLFSFIVRARATFFCQLYGFDHIECGGTLECAHLVTRNIRALRCDVKNARCICQNHHRYYSTYPEFWQRQCAETWTQDWQYVTDKKWQSPDTAIDREAIFKSLLMEAQTYITVYVEFTPKLQAIETWSQKRESKEKEK